MGNFLSSFYFVINFPQCTLITFLLFKKRHFFEKE